MKKHHKMDFWNDEPNISSYNKKNHMSHKQMPVHSLTRDRTFMLSNKTVVYGLNHGNPSFYASNVALGQEKPIFTILLPTTQILVVNSAACKFLSYSSRELCSMKFHNLLSDQYKYKLTGIYGNHMSGQVLFEEGNHKLRIVELVDKDGSLIPVCILFKFIDSYEKCLAVVEPIERKVAMFIVDKFGKIISCDNEAVLIFHYHKKELIGSDIGKILPNVSLYLRENKYKSGQQKLNGRSKHGTCVPLNMIFEKNADQGGWRITVLVYINLNGIIILDNDFNIIHCNFNFLKLLFGTSEENILNQKISTFIPNFVEDLKRVSKLSTEQKYDDYSRNHIKRHNMTDFGSRRRTKEKNKKKQNYKSYLDLVINSNINRNFKSGSFSACSDHCYCSNYYDCKIWLRNQLSKESSLNIRLSKSDCDLNSEDDFHYCTANEKSISNEEIHRNYGKQLAARSKEKNENLVLIQKLAQRERYVCSHGKRCDGTIFPLLYKVKIIFMADETFYRIWISRGPWPYSNFYPEIVKSPTLTNVSNFPTDESFGNDNNLLEELSRQSSLSVMPVNDDVLCNGEYSKLYTNIQQIGKGAFGYVKMAFRNSDGLLVVTKFIQKQKINIRSWVYDSKLKLNVPLEISLLTSLKHPNIVEVLDVFHNDLFFQLVMRKHGGGMDLFEFIERKPKSDEKLNSYIFRQIVSAVFYLDSIGVLHRDIKDENVIINEFFTVKLIDFGSAAYMSPGKIFSVFYGTVEYCSPEVLQGNRYRGPELEIWALGVTLYVLIFGQNPFSNVQETIKGVFTIPHTISSNLFNLLHRMLEKDVNKRITIGQVAVDPWVVQFVNIYNYRFEDIVPCTKGESDPPNYLIEFSFSSSLRNEAGNEEEDNDSDNYCNCDRRMDSNNPSCSLQCNPENFYKSEEFRNEYFSSVSSFKSSKPPPNAAFYRLINKIRESTKSVGSLNGTRGNVMNCSNQACGFCSNNFLKKRFGLNANSLTGLNRTYLDCSFQNWTEEVAFKDSKKNSSSDETLESRRSTAYQEFSNMNDNRSLEEDSAFFWHAKNKFTSKHYY